MPGIRRGHTGVLDALELDLCLVVHYHVDSGNKPGSSAPANQCSKLLMVMKMRSSGLDRTGNSGLPTAKHI